MILHKGNKPNKRLHSMDTEEVSIVNAGANGHTKWLMVKSADGKEIAQQIPVDSESPEVKKGALESRSKRYGIEALSEGGNLTVEKGMPSAESLYGDPVNLLYPMGDGENAVSEEVISKSLETFREGVGSYSEDLSKSRILERIVRKAISKGMDIQFDPENEIDNLLPGDLKSTLQKDEGGDKNQKSEDGDGDGSGSSVEGSSQTPTSKSGEQDPAPDFKTEISKSRGVVERYRTMRKIRELREEGLRAIESVKKKSPSEPSSPQDGVDNTKTVKKDPEKANLEKRAADQAVEIEQLQKQLTQEKAKKSRQSTAIGMSTSLRPRETIGTAKVDQADQDEAAAMFDLSPPLPKEI